jgi:hypothetical protein
MTDRMMEESVNMKKMIMCAAVAVMAVTSAVSGPFINWGSDYAFTSTGAPDCVDKDGNVIPATSTWAVQLMNSATMLPLYTAPYSPGVGFWEILGTAGTGYSGIDGSTSGLDGWNGLTVFTRVWAASSPGNPATDWHADTPTSILAWTTVPPATLANYNFGEITQPMWVPEPGTGLLVLAGAAVAIFRRRRAEA